MELPIHTQSLLSRLRAGSLKAWCYQAQDRHLWRVTSHRGVGNGNKKRVKTLGLDDSVEHLDPTMPKTALITEAQSCNLVTFLIWNQGFVACNTETPD